MSYCVKDVQPSLFFLVTSVAPVFFFLRNSNLIIILSVTLSLSIFSIKWKIYVYLGGMIVFFMLKYISNIKCLNIYVSKHYIFHCNTVYDICKYLIFKY